MLLTKKERKKERNRPKTIPRPLPGRGNNTTDRHIHTFEAIRVIKDKNSRPISAMPFKLFCAFGGASILQSILVPFKYTMSKLYDPAREVVPRP